MKAIIFAGGVGTRLWPLSRKKSPKQFEKIVGDKSTLQLAVNRLLPSFKVSDIYISTGKAYVNMVASQLTMIPKRNVIGEPVKKDVGPAVGFAMAYLEKKFPNEPVVILWSDHLIKKEERFRKILKEADRLIRKDSNKVIFIGQKARFPSDNLGWIETGKQKIREGKVKFLEFTGFKYRPNKQLAEKYFQDKRYCWNLGYFVATPKFMTGLFKRFAPKIYSLSQKIVKNIGKKNLFNTNFRKIYQQMPEISFDKAILEKLNPKLAYVVVDDIGWSDVGAWEALKEALERKREDNIIKGKVFLEDSVDNLVYNYHHNKLIVGIDLESLLVVDTGDVLLVAKKTSVPKIKRVVKSFQGTDNENLT